jgi:predicted enzyme related to lactoylglutathione lyase
MNHFPELSDQRGENIPMTMPQRHWWHELNTWEPEAALAFYGRTLGWEFEPATLPDGGGYWIARKDGKPVGGIFELTAPDYEGIPSHWMTYLSVGDIDKAEVETSRSGGEIMRPPVKIPGVGKLAVVNDATGAMIGLIEPDMGHALASVH